VEEPDRLWLAKPTSAGLGMGSVDRRDFASTEGNSEERIQTEDSVGDLMRLLSQVIDNNTAKTRPFRAEGLEGRKRLESDSNYQEWFQRVWPLYSLRFGLCLCPESGCLRHELEALWSASH
jgi:hypothetical protein